MSKHTPGPWAWFGNKHGFYLATIHGGRKYVMDFVRMGMHGAQPRFQPTCGMEKAEDLCTFEVGKNNVVGMKAAEKDGSVYRYDINGIDCADARLIAAAPELLEACKAAMRIIDLWGPQDCTENSDHYVENCALALMRNGFQEAILKAEGAE